jgi:hypothetical protein
MFRISKVEGEVCVLEKIVREILLIDSRMMKKVVKYRESESDLFGG